MQHSKFRSPSSKEAVLQNANRHFSGGERRIDAAKLEIAAARAASDANTLRLRTLRLAKEQSVRAADGAAAVKERYDLG